MDDPARILEDRVEDLARAIANTINGAEIPGRPDIRADLRDLAIGLLQDSVIRAEPVAVAVVEGADSSFNPLGMGIPLFFAGGVLIFLFPPVGMTLFAASAMMIVWGLMTSLLARARRG